MTRLSILTFAPAPSPAAEPEDNGYVALPAPVTVDSIPTQAGAIVRVYQDSDGSLSSTCTGCGEYAWTVLVTPEFAQEHAAACLRPPRRRAA
ncbi:hypothetical protein [Streptomyces sp. NPDC088180]|uniref:hypothetical protein n=1 Tax=Streptomyces sp. NPDC088180 TaxID=3365837 RepID=UPI0037F3714B